MNLETTLGLINKNIRDLKAYHLEPEDTVIKLNQNENPFDWPLTSRKKSRVSVSNGPGTAIRPLYRRTSSMRSPGTAGRRKGASLSATAPTKCFWCCFFRWRTGRQPWFCASRPSPYIAF